MIIPPAPEGTWERTLETPFGEQIGIRILKPTPLNPRTPADANLLVWSALIHRIEKLEAEVKALRETKETPGARELLTETKVVVE